MATRSRAPRSTATTKLARLRVQRGVSREDLARVVGTSTSTLGRLERDELEEIPLRVLSNCALALGVQLEELIEDSWREWWDPYGGQPEPPDPESFWRS